ncbi:hypothetical protein [Actinocorallia longicatena]|uniref:hypothetical protein n=1 Tax=Actinocorallia longicatena TaxID=111803 RepID=UPI0031DE5932
MSIVAALAALSGSTLTYLFQRRTARDNERFSREQRLWQERVAAYSSFVAAATDFRRSQNDRWHLEREDPQSAPFIAAREESYRLRAQATAAACRVRLVCGDPEIGRHAQRALDIATDVHLGIDENDRATRGAAARQALDEFLTMASTHVNGPRRT